MNASNSPPPVPFPPAPWRSRGTMWIGLLTTRQPPEVPAELSALFDPRHLVAMLIRYREGTLRYDEFIIGTPVRCGLRAGLWPHAVWVDDTASLWGGRRIWGLPKELATFAWSDRGVRLTGPANATVTLTLTPQSRWWLPIALVAPAFGGTGDELRYFTGRLCGRAAAATIGVTAWPDELPALTRETARGGLRVSRFRMVTGRPTRLRTRGAGPRAAT